MLVYLHNSKRNHTEKARAHPSGKEKRNVANLTTLTDELPQFVLFTQAVYLREQDGISGQGGPAEKQRKGLCAGQRPWVEGEPLGLFVGADGRPAVLQHGAERLQEEAELRGRRAQPDGTTEIEVYRSKLNRSASF